ncbi:hypothetical protein CHH62_19940 [Niallia circulans]|uniref:hybrid sensor histidine kinase/response regulator n=1 Tax=Niallia circulans TaxID=1397 RepID=UPI000BA662AD|nr:ATP-binding protein [Niallia circulans]PAD23948.1 hypothetical protein CHH62_19940 [Niallia circulans]
MKKSIGIIIACCIFILSIISIVYSSWSNHTREAKISNGQINLTSVSFDNKDIIHLNGEWEFYKNQLITPIPNKNIFDSYERELRYVPGLWSDNKSKAPFIAGTYRITITVPKDGLYGIKVNAVNHASKLFINGIEAGESGNPSKDKSDYRPYIRKYSGIGRSENHKIEIVIQAASHNQPLRGGVIQPIEFGSATQILTSRESDRTIETLLLGGYLVLGVFYLFSFFYRMRDIHQLYFSLFCILQGVYVAFINEKIIELVIPSISVYLLSNIQLLLFHSALLFFLWFIHGCFKEFTSQKVIQVISILLMIDGLLYGVPGVSANLLWFLPIFTKQIMIVLLVAPAYVYIGFVLIKALVNKSEGSQYLIIIVSSFISYGLVLGVNFLFATEIGRIPLILFLFMTIGLALYMGLRFYQAFIKIEKLSESLQVQDKLKDEFLIKTSHELRTPLNGILNLSRLMLEGKEGPLSIKHQESLALIHNVGKRLANLVEDLLNASDIKTNNIALFPKSLNLKIIDEVIKEMYLLVPVNKNITISNKINAHLPNVYVDEARLIQIFYNLISNAIKYTDNGEITITADVINNKMEITVTDTGMGIKEEELEQIFTTFYQSERTINRGTDGLGLGLAITKQLVLKSGGEIFVKSKVGQGSQFSFTLPLASTGEKLPVETLVRPEESIVKSQENKEKLQLPLPLIENGKSPYTILVVDDEHANLKVVVNLLKMLNHSIIAVDNGKMALEIIKERKIDLLVADLMMPEINGYDLCNIIREEYHLVELPILILTASGQIADLTKSFIRGANDFLRKPIEPEELNARVTSLLTMKNAAEQAVNNELNYFYAQIKPHFLFNTLNSIIGLSYRDMERAREGLYHLSTYFRGKLDLYRKPTLISIQEEMELVQAYLAIEQLRFGEDLQVKFDIEEDIQMEIPALTIQPLVENAVQHGFSYKKKGVISIIIKRVEPKIVNIIISDNGKGMNEESRNRLLQGKSNGMGFSNALKKLKLLKNSKLLLESTEHQGTKIIIILPEVRRNEGHNN